MLKENEFLFLENLLSKKQLEDYELNINSQYELGRQNGLYLKKKCTIGNSYIKEIQRFFYHYNFLDCWHLKIQSDIPNHIDPINNETKHFRLNIVTHNSCIMCPGKQVCLLNEGDAVLFRTDLTYHSLELIENKPCEIISIGIIC